MTYASPGNVTSATDMMQYLNGTVSDFLFAGIILAVYAILLIIMLTNQGNTVGKSVGASSFICMILAVFCRVLNLVDTRFMTLFIFLSAIGAIWMHFENTNGG